MNDLMRAVASSRPARLDEDPTTRPDPGPIMVRPQLSARPRRRLVLAGAVPVAAAAVAGAVIIGGSLVRPDSPPGRGATGSSVAASPGSSAAGTPRTARDLLLVAADQTARTADTGKYLRTELEHGERVEVGPVSHPYAIMRLADEERWLPTRPGVPQTMALRMLGAKPAGAADVAAWKADGSPRQWIQEGPDNLPDVVISMASGERQVRTLPVGFGLLLSGDAISVPQLAALPTDPAALRAWLLDRFRHDGGTEPTDYRLFMSGRALVAELPASAAVRAAAFRMLAGVQGVRLLGQVTDRRGRTGDAVAYVRGDHQDRLIVDGARVLAEEAWYRGTLMSYQLVVEAGFTDENPPS